MNTTELLNRIESNPQILSGKPVIKGTRLSVAFIMKAFATGSTEADLLAEYQGLSPQDLQACHLYAAEI
jgi:uncharacterized protein (DUF433 family)